MEYRADVDGLRAVAVLSVVLYHADLSIVSGGYVGVDVFFVISGFLITRIIVGEIAENRFSIAGFYERRIRRIFPALFATLLVTFVLCSLLLLPDDFVSLAESAVAATLFVSNIHFWSTSDYFAPASEFNPLLHTWSLAVEEQFYILHPILLMLILGYAHRWLRPLLVAGVVVSLGCCIGLTIYNPETAFYLIPSRAWELFLGALIAIGAVPAVPVRFRGIEAALGMGCIALAVLGFTDRTPFPGAAALVPCLGAASIIHAGQSGDSLTARILSLKPVVFVGLISYSLYLWHWPALVMPKYFFVSTKLPAWVVAVALMLAMLLATLSWRYIERPFRDRRRFDRTKIFYAGGATMLAAIALCGPVLVSGGFPGRFGDATLALAAASGDRDQIGPKCLSLRVDRLLVEPTCLIGQRDPAEISFLLWGDSHAEAIMPAVSKAAADAGRTGVFIGRGACPPLIGITRASGGQRYACPTFNQLVLELVRDSPSLEIVLLAARWALSSEGMRYKGEPGTTVFIVDAESNEISFPENRAAFHRGLRRTLAELHGLGRQVVLIGPVPEVGWHVPKMLAMRSYTGVERRIRPTGQEFHDRQAFALDALAALGGHYNTSFVFPHDYLCAQEPCVIESEGRPLYRDDDHLSRFGARALSGLFEPIFAR